MKGGFPTVPLLPRFVVTAGPTREYLDPVRFLSNPSTGRMGFAVARAARCAGCEVTLITGPVVLRTPVGVKRVDVVSAMDMLAAVRAATRGERDTILVMTAAVADWRPASCADSKLKKSTMKGVIRLVRNPDILRTIKDELATPEHAYPQHFIRIGFAAETGNPEQEGARKCRDKGLAFVVGNDVTKPGCGFGTYTNRVSLLFPDGSIERLPLLSKAALAKRIVTRALRSCSCYV